MVGVGSELGTVDHTLFQESDILHDPKSTATVEPLLKDTPEIRTPLY